MKNKTTLFLSFLFFFTLISETLNAQVKITNETKEILQSVVNDYVYQESKGIAVSQNVQEQYKCFFAINKITYINMQGFINPDFESEILENLGIIISSRIGKVASFKIPIKLAAEIEELPGIYYLETPPDFQPFLDKAVSNVRADSVHWGIDLPQSYTGKDVIVGVIDWGFDYTHPVFYDTVLNRYRIIAAWDHFKKSGPSPAKFNYGTEYVGKEELLAAGSDTAYGTVYETHGTHVAGIAGGGGAGIGLVGMAYDCDFLLVQPKWEASSFLDCVDWLYEKSKQEGKRLVINMSFGSYNKSTLDTTGVYHEVAKEYTKRGVVFVASAGNNGSNRMHVKKTFNNDEMNTQINMYPSNTTFPNYSGQFVLAWGEPGKSFECALDIYQGQTRIYEGQFFNTNDVTSYEENVRLHNNSMYFKVEAEKSHPLNHKPKMSFIIRKSYDSWRVVLRAKATDGTVHFWNIVQGTSGTTNTGYGFLSMQHQDWLKGNDSFAVSDPGATPYIITIAAHNAETKGSISLVPGAIADFSSQGPTLDNLIKPNISAPGYQVLSSISTFTTQSYVTDRTVDFNGKTYPFAKLSGTSMSSPCVTGIVALLLEANPELSPRQIQEILTETAYQDENTGVLSPLYGDATWGTGKVNAYDAIKISLETKGVLYKSGSYMVYPNPVSGTLFYKGEKYDSAYDVKIFDVHGKLVYEGQIGAFKPIDLTNLLNGIYVVRINDKEWTSHKIIVTNHQ